MIKEPKLPHKLKWGDWTAARVAEVESSRGLKECRQLWCFREEAASRGVLQVYKT